MNKSLSFPLGLVALLTASPEADACLEAGLTLAQLGVFDLLTSPRPMDENSGLIPSPWFPATFRPGLLVTSGHPSWRRQGTLIPQLVWALALVLQGWSLGSPVLPARALGGPGQASDEVNLSYVRQEPIRPTRLPLLGVSAVAGKDHPRALSPSFPNSPVTSCHSVI